MRPASLKLVDRWLYRGALPAGWLLSRLLPRATRERPLIVRPGGLGDLVCVCMAVEDLGADPRAFDWLIEERSRPWAEHLGIRFTCYDRDAPALVWRAARSGYRVVINTEQRFGLAQAAALALTAREGRLTCFDTSRGARWASEVVAYDRDGSHEVLEFRRLLAAALSLKEPDSLSARPRARPGTGPLVVGLAGTGCASRSLSREAWTRLVAAWAGSKPFVVTAAPPDRPLAHALAGAFPGQGRVHEGPFSRVCEAIANAPRCLTVDGALVHVASYYGVPATAVFTSGIHTKWAPLASGSELVRRDDLSCQPCARFGQVPPCPHGLVCKQVDYARHRRERAPTHAK